MRFSAIELALGCSNTTLPSALTLKLFQLRAAEALCWFTVSVLPLCCAVTEPEDTKPGTFGPQLPAAQGTGSVAGTADPGALESSTTKPPPRHAARNTPAT